MTATKPSMSMLDAKIADPGYLFGLTLSNNAVDAVNDIDIAAGVATDSTGLVRMAMASAITKQLDVAWAVGTNQGGRMSAAPISNATYHVFLIFRPDTEVVDVGFDESPTAPTLPTGYTKFRRIGSIMRGSGAIRQFSQFGDEFLWASPTLDFSTTTLGTAAVLSGLPVPSGVRLKAKIRGMASHASAGTVISLTSPDQADVAPGSSGVWVPSAGGYGAFDFDLRTDTSGQIRARAESANASLRIVCYGFIDRRGRVA